MRYFRRYVSIVVLSVLAVYCLGQSSASAHELKADNGISAVLHIVPDDNPESGQDTLFDFAFNSDRPGFDLGYCKCQVSFQASNNRLDTAPITPDSSSPGDGTATLRFDTPGVYDVVVRGLIAADPANTFTLSYRIRVVAGTSAAQAAARRTSSWQIILLSLTSLVITGVIANEFIRRGSHYGKKPKG